MIAEAIRPRACLFPGNYAKAMSSMKNTVASMLISVILLGCYSDFGASDRRVRSESVERFDRLDKVHKAYELGPKQGAEEALRQAENETDQGTKLMLYDWATKWSAEAGDQAMSASIREYKFAPLKRQDEEQRRVYIERVTELQDLQSRGNQGVQEEDRNRARKQEEAQEAAERDRVAAESRQQGTELLNAVISGMANRTIEKDRALAEARKAEYERDQQAQRQAQIAANKQAADRSVAEKERQSALEQQREAQQSRQLNAECQQKIAAAQAERSRAASATNCLSAGQSTTGGTFPEVVNRCAEAINFGFCTREECRTQSYSASKVQGFGRAAVHGWPAQIWGCFAGTHDFVPVNAKAEGGSISYRCKSIPGTVSCRTSSGDVDFVSF